LAAGITLAGLTAAIAHLTVEKRRPIRLAALAAASVLLGVGAGVLIQRHVPRAPITALTDVSTQLAATDLVSMAELPTGVVQRAGIIVPEVPDEPLPPPAARVQALPPRAALPPRRADAVPSPMALAPRPAVNDAVPADSSSLALERPREALLPAPIPAPPAEAARASRTDEARVDSTPPPADGGADGVVPAPLPAPRTDAVRSDGAALAANDGITEALKHLEVAYGRRDATLAKAVWPTVNERALARAFDGLRSQSVTFDRCKMDVAGGAGEVECHGVTTYVTRVGSQDRRTESRQWKFRVKKADDSWLIVSAAAR
jgi:hypothetical protein